MPSYTHYFKPFIESGKIKDLKEALSHCDDEWTLTIITGYFPTTSLKIVDVDVSYSSEAIQIDMKEVVE